MRKYVAKDFFVWALRSRRIVTICLNCASQKIFIYLPTYLYDATNKQ